MEIVIREEKVYGISRFYPENLTALIIAKKLIGCETLTPKQLRTLQELGYTIKLLYGESHKEVVRF